MAKDKEKLLQSLRTRKRNRTLEELQEVLDLYGFSCRPGSKEQGGVWERGRHRVVLPKPHGDRDKTLGMRYISIAISVIDAAEAEDALKEHDKGEVN